MKSGDTDPRDDRFLDELGAMFRAYEGPARPVPRPMGARMRVRPLAIIAALFAVFAAGAAAAVTGLTESNPSSAQALRHVNLPPLLNGPNSLEGVSGALGSMIGIPMTPEEIMLQAIRCPRFRPSIFVGRVIAIGRKETGVRAATGESFTYHIVRYQVESVFSGDRVDTLDLADKTYWEFPAEIGRRYLVVASPDSFDGFSGLSATMFYVYPMIGVDTAMRLLTSHKYSSRTVRLSELERLARRIPAEHRSPCKQMVVRGVTGRKGVS